MNQWRRSRFGNPAAWYTAIGSSMLALSLAIPWLSASRTTRVEERADGIAEALLSASEGLQTPFSEVDLQCLLARFYMVASSHGLWTSDIEREADAPDGALLCLRNKHYAFQVSESPIDANARAGQDCTGSVEILAWPLSTVGPGHCVFFYAQDASRAYSRNLRKSYAGLDGSNQPTPGAAHRRPGLGSLRRSQYAGNDNERWVIY